jgi:hypothetical protein
MQTREEIIHLVDAINQEAKGDGLRLRDEDHTKLERLVQSHPEVWPSGLADTLTALRKRLQGHSIDREAIPSPLLDFFDRTYKRDLDPMALARQIGQEMHAACEDCGCKC